MDILKSYRRLRSDVQNVLKCEVDMTITMAEIKTPKSQMKNEKRRLEWLLREMIPVNEKIVCHEVIIGVRCSGQNSGIGRPSSSYF